MAPGERLTPQPQPSELDYLLSDWGAFTAPNDVRDFVGRVFAAWQADREALEQECRTYRQFAQQAVGQSWPPHLMLVSPDIVERAKQVVSLRALLRRAELLLRDALNSTTGEDGDPVRWLVPVANDLQWRDWLAGVRAVLAETGETK